MFQNYQINYKELLKNLTQKQFLEPLTVLNPY